MNCDILIVKENLMALIESHPEEYGIPLDKAVALLLGSSEDEGMDCTEDDIRRVIIKLLDDWIIDKTLDHVSPEDATKFDIDPGRPVWHLKILSDEGSEHYQNLKEREKALIRILRSNTGPEDLGRMRVDKAVELLEEKGFTEGTEHIHIYDVVTTSYEFTDGETIAYYEIVDEASKTPEFKAAMERQSQRVREKMKEWEEIEAADRARSEKRRKKGN